MRSSLRHNRTMRAISKTRPLSRNTRGRACRQHIVLSAAAFGVGRVRACDEFSDIVVPPGSSSVRSNALVNSDSFIIKDVSLNSYRDTIITIDGIFS